MVAQETLNGEDRATASRRHPVSSGLAESLHELIALLELQAELFKIDVRECWKSLLAPSVMLIVALLLALACVPIGLLMIAALLIEAGLRPSAALLIVVLLSLSSAAGLVMTGASRLRHSLNVFTRSREEWQRTVQSIKLMLRRSSHSREDTSRRV